MSDQSRRKLLKSIAAGSGAIVAGKSLPESWTKPVVNSVVLPAHAQTSQTRFTGASSSYTLTSIGSDNVFAKVVDNLLPIASAGSNGVHIYTVQTHLCISNVGDGNVDVEAVIEFAEDDIVLESNSYAAEGIAADGSEQTLGLVMRGCVDGSNLLDKLGLVNDAYAGGIPGGNASITVMTGTTAIGVVSIGSDIMDYDISGTECNLPGLVCDIGK